MNIVIPKSTLPGAVKNLANDVSEFGDVVKSFEDQKNLVTAQRIENDMKVHLDKFDAEMLKNSDGTEEGLFDKIRAGHDKIRNDYSNQAPNFAVSRYLKQTGAADGGVRLRRVQGALDEKLYNTSVNAVKIKVDDEIRTALQTGEFGTGLQSIEEYMVAQSGFFGADTNKIATDAKQRYAYHYLKTGLTNPQTAPMLAQRLSDPEQKQMFFSMLPVEALDDVERLLENAQGGVRAEQAFNAVVGDKRFYNIDGTINAAKLRAHVMTPAFAKKHSLRFDDQRELYEHLSRMGAAQEAMIKKQDSIVEADLVKIGLSGNLTEMAVKNSSLSIGAKERILGNMKTPTTPEGFKTDPVVEAEMWENIVRNPEAVTAVDIVLGVGRGLSPATAEKLIAQREKFVSGKIDPHRKDQATIILDGLKKAHDNEVFGSGPEGRAEYSRMVTSFQSWLIRNPDGDPAEWYKQAVEPKEQGWISRMLDWLAENREKPLKRENAGKQAAIPKGAQTGTYKGIRAYKLDNKYYSIETGKEI